MAKSLVVLRRELTALNAELAVLKTDLVAIERPPGTGGTLYISEFESQIGFGPSQHQFSLNDTYYDDSERLRFNDSTNAILNGVQNLPIESFLGFTAAIGGEIEVEEE